MSISQVHVVAFLEARRGFISRLASHYHLEFDDLYQESALVALEKSSDGGDNPEAYLAGCIKLQALILSNKNHQHVSLDKPFDTEDDQAGSLVDVLPAATPVSEREQVATDQRIKAVHQALRRLPREEQAYLKRVYKLNAFSPVSHRGRAFRQSSACNLCHQAYRHLRKDATLAAAALAGGAR